MRLKLQNLGLFDRRQLLAVLSVGLILCAVLAGLTDGNKAKAATLATINFQARLMNGEGSIAQDGDYNVEFKLYDVASGGGTAQGSCSGNCVWMETRTSGNKVRVVNGYVTVNLGSVTAFGSTINWNQDIWLTMNVGGTGSPSWDGEMSPRLKLTAVPYAFRAGQLAQFNSGTGFTSTLSIVQPTGGNQTFQIPDQGAAGTYTLLTTNTANANYIQLQGSSPGTPQTGNFNISGTGIAGTALQAPLFQTADGTGASTALTLRSGNSTSSGNTGNLTVATGNATSGNSGNISIDVGTASATKGTISIGTTNASAVNLGNNAAPLTVVSAGSSSWANTDGTLALSVSGTSGGSGSDISITSVDDLSIFIADNGTNSFEIRQSGNDYVDIITTNGSEAITFGDAAINPTYTFAGSDVATFGGTVAIQGANALTLGVTGTSTGAVLFKGATGGSGTLTLSGPASPNTNNYTLSIPAITNNANICTDNSICTGYQAAGSYEAPLTFNNGLTRSVNTVSLGGALTQATTISADNAQSLTVTSALTGGARSANLLTLSQADDATNNMTGNLLRVDQLDTATASSAVYIDNNSTAAGGYALTVDNANTTTTGAAIRIVGVAGANVRGIDITGVTTGTGVLLAVTTGTGINANTVTTGNAVSATGITTGAGLSVTATTTGRGLLYNTTANGLTTGSAVAVTGAASAITADYTGAYLNVDPTRTLTAATTRTDSGQFLRLVRSNTVNNASGTYNVTGALALLQSNCTQTAGTCADSANILHLNQQYASASGAVLNIQGAGTGNLATLDATNTSANGVSIDLQSSSTSQFALNLTSNNGSTNILSARADGNVGLGTTSPDSKLHVIGGLCVEAADTGCAAGTGTVLIQGTNSTTALNVKNGSANNVFTVDTSNGRVGINLGGNNVPVLASAGLEINGALRLSGTVVDTFTTPQSASVNTKINVPIFDPGANGQIIAFGLPSSAQATARALSLFDARTVDHQPTLAVFSPDENHVVGFGWNGSNTSAYAQTNSRTSGGDSRYLVLQSGNVAGGNGDSGNVQVNTGTIAGGTGGTTGSIFVVTGTGSGTNSSSGSITIDSGGITGSGTAGSVTIGGTNAPSLNLGRAAGTTTLNGTVKVSTLGSTTANAVAVCRDSSTTNLIACDAASGASFIQGGNSFGATAVLGTNDANNLQFETNNVVRATFDQSNGLYLGNGVTAASPNNFTVSGTGSTTAGTAGANITLQGGAGASATTGSAGGNVLIAGGNADGSGNNAGGIVTLQGGLDTNTGVPGKVLVKNSADSATAFQVQNAAGTSTVFDVDTASGYVGIGTAAPTRQLDISINNSTTNAPPILIQQAGSGDSSLEFKTTAKSWIVGADASNNSSFTINSSTASSSALLGSTSGAATDSGNQNTYECSKFTAGASGTVTSIAVRLGVNATAASPNDQFSMAIYTGTATQPTTLLAAAGNGTLNAAGTLNTLPISATIANGTVYWLCANNNSNNSNLSNWAYTSGQPANSSYFLTGQTFASGWSSSIVGGTTGGTAQYAFSINYTPSGSYDSFASALFTMTDTGQTIFRNSVDSSTALQIQNAAGTNTVLGVDASNGRVGINTAAPTADLSFGAGANRVINVLAQPTAATAGNNLTINSGQGNTSGAGGILLMQAGQGGTSGAGGATTVQGGSGGTTSGAGGLVTIQGGNATAGNSAAGGVSVLGGAAQGTGAASVITITAGNGVSGQNTAGGAVNITSGTGGGTQNGGTIALLAGNGGTTGNGGQVTLTGGNGGSSGVRTGGNVSILGGTGNTTGTGGNVSLQGGVGGATGNGGTATVQGGTGGGTSGVGGAVSINGGTAVGAFAGGDVTVQGGTAASTAGSNGGSVTVRGSAGTSTGTGGAGGGLTLQGGNAGGSGNNAGGSINMQSGSSTGTGAASTISITSGAGASGNNVQGGGLTVATGAGGGNQAGGTLALQAGTGGATGNGGAITITGGTAGGATLLGGAITIRAGTGNTSGIGGALNLQGGTGGNAASGGVVAIQGGNAGGGNTNGANVTIAGGTATGTGAQGLVVINTPTMNTTTTDANCGATTAVSCTIAAATVNNTSSVLVGATATNVTVDMPNPTIVTAGRIFYFTAFGSTSDFTLRLNNGDPGVISIAMRNNSTATLIWNGSDWTAAGASSSTDLQSAYNNTLASAGAAELILNAPGGNADGLTIRNNATTPIVGGLLEVQTSIGSNLLTVNNNATEYATNGGAETAGGTSSTFPSNTWDTTTGGTVDRWTTAGDNIATGQASVRVQTTTTNHGARNRISAALTSGLTYNVSFAVRGATNFNTLQVLYSPDGTTTGTTQCATAQVVTSGIWTRITCSFVASGTITSSNSMLIRQTDATARTFYIDNLSININASATFAADGSVDNAGAFGTNWTDFDGGTGSTTITRETTVIYDTSASTAGATTANANQGIRNNMAINPSINTQYLVSFYARSTNTMTGSLAVGFLPAGGTTPPSGTAACTDYNTQSLVANTWTKITCLFTTTGTAISNPDLVMYQTDATARTIYVDALSITLNTNNSSNVQVGGANKGGPTTLLTLDRASTAPIAANNEAYLGSMYYDTTSGRIQCYEADGWGACGAAPDNIVNLNPEYAGAVLNGSGIGTMTADFCSNDTALTVNTTLCSTGQAKNFYRWTSPQATQQTYSIYVTYQLPATFNGFASDDTVQLVARVDNTTNASVTYEMYKSTGSAVTQCGSGETNVITGGGGSANTWYSFGINGNESTGCSFNSSSAGNFVIFKINVKANSNANAYVSTLSFTTTGR